MTQKRSNLAFVLLSCSTVAEVLFVVFGLVTELCSQWPVLCMYHYYLQLKNDMVPCASGLFCVCTAIYSWREWVEACLVCVGTTTVSSWRMTLWIDACLVCVGTTTISSWRMTLWMNACLVCVGTITICSWRMTLWMDACLALWNKLCDWQPLVYKVGSPA